MLYFKRNRYGYPVPKDKLKLCEEEYSKESLALRMSYSSKKLKDRLIVIYDNLKKFTSRR